MTGGALYPFLPSAHPHALDMSTLVLHDHCALLLQFVALLETGLVTHNLVVWDKQSRQLHRLLVPGSRVCGYKGLAHGGITAAILDETLGNMDYAVKHAGLLPQGVAFTVHLSVDYRKVRHWQTFILSYGYNGGRVNGFFR